MIETNLRFKINVDGCEEAKEYLRTIGKSDISDSGRYDGYTIIQVANRLYEEGAHEQKEK